MSRYIDADALKEENKTIIDCEIEHPKYQNTVREIIDSAPTIEIVRCKECKWVEEHQFTNGSQLECHCKYKEYEKDPYCCSYWIVNIDDFCSYGERKDDE